MVWMTLTKRSIQPRNRLRETLQENAMRLCQVKRRVREKLVLFATRQPGQQCVHVG